MGLIFRFSPRALCMGLFRGRCASPPDCELTGCRHACIIPTSSMTPSEDHVLPICPTCALDTHVKTTAVSLEPPLQSTYAPGMQVTANGDVDLQDCMRL